MIYIYIPTTVYYVIINPMQSFQDKPLQDYSCLSITTAVNIKIKKSAKN